MGDDSSSRDGAVERQEAVDAINKSFKTEQIIEYWVRTKNDKVSKPRKPYIRDLIDLHMEKKGDDRMVIDYMVTDVVVGQTDLDDPDVMLVETASGKRVLIADYLEEREGELDTKVAEYIRVLFRKLKDREAVIRAMEE